MKLSKFFLSYFLCIVFSGFVNTAFADVEEDECNAYSYNSSKKEAHIYEFIPSGTSYLGWYYDYQENKNILALCVKDQLKPLHFTDKKGKKGALITVNSDGELGWHLSFCSDPKASSKNNILKGALGISGLRCDSQFFNQAVAKEKFFKVYTLQGDDDILGIISAHDSQEAKKQLVSVRGGSGDDWIDMAYAQDRSFHLIPAYSALHGESGNDYLLQEAYSGPSASVSYTGYDTCYGGSGNDFLVCYRHNGVKSYCDGNAGTDGCYCGSEGWVRSCEEDYW